MAVKQIKLVDVPKSELRMIEVRCNHLSVPPCLDLLAAPGRRPRISAVLLCECAVVLARNPWLTVKFSTFSCFRLRSTC